ncbi:MAG: hypothetical protein GY765_02555, partial [bacterium]|nr:hypothetical protein [bacterium]
MLILFPTGANGQSFTRIGDGPFATDTGNSNGCAWGDYDNDGFADLFVCNDAGSVNFLYHNNGDGTFTKITSGAPVTEDPSIPSMGAAWGDYNNDGFLDLFVTNYNADNFLYRNNGNGTFTKITTDVIVCDHGSSQTPTWVDLNNDGLLDLFVANYTEQNDIYINKGDDSFKKLFGTALTSFSRPTYMGAWSDLDNDGDKDSFEFSNAYLFENNGAETFTRITSGGLTTDASNGISISVGDYDNDGWPDLFFSTVGSGVNRLYRNTGNWGFQSISASPLTTDSFDARASTWGDFDNDGDLDMFVLNLGGNNYLYRNDNGDFVRITAGAMVSDGGTSRGCALADYDNDGDLDMFVANSQGESNGLYRNDYAGTNHWLKVRCTGDDAVGLGARIRVRALINGSSVTQTREIRSNSGLRSQGESTAFFGLGNATAVDEVTVTWPSGASRTYTSLAVDSQLNASFHPTEAPADGLRLTAPNGGQQWLAGSTQTITWNTGAGLSATDVKIEYSTDNGKIYKTIIDATENDGSHIWTVPDTPSSTCRIRVGTNAGSVADAGDFCFVILPRPIDCFTVSDGITPKVNGNSFVAGWGDYDNDGFPDLLTADFSGETHLLYHNNGDGTFSGISSEPLTSDGSNTSHTAARWVDYDNDGDLDIFISRNNNRSNSLYRNDGNNTFIKITDGPLVTDLVNDWTPVWFDFDNDGDLDLFSANYDRANKLYRNDGSGGFTSISGDPLVDDTSDTVGCSVCDYDNDGDMDVFLANGGSQKNGLFRNDNGAFVKITEGPIYEDTDHSYTGSWGDYDNDGDMDLFVANATSPDSASGNRLYTNNNDGTFTRMEEGPVGQQSGNGNSIDGLWVDYDNDGDVDLFVINKGEEADYLFQNHNGTFSRRLDFDFTEAGDDTRTLVAADYDRDGDVDLYGINYSHTDRLYRNDTSGNNWLHLRLKGTLSNSFGLGARVTLTAEINGQTVTQVRQLSGQNFKVQHESIVWFGLGDATQVAELKITWPSGNVQVFNNLPVNRLQVIHESPNPGPSEASLMLMSPNGGENMDVGRTLNITWLGSQNIATVHLQYSTDNGTNWSTIAASVPNTGTYNWTLPALHSSQCLIKISDTAGKAEDLSNNVFSIISSTLTLLTPQASTAIYVGTTEDITWSSTGTMGDVKIEYSTDNGVSYKSISTGTANTGTFSWLIPNDISETCVMRLSSGTVQDTTDGIFVIAPKVSITSPAAGTQWLVGDTGPISWTCDGDLNEVTLEYSIDGGLSYSLLATTANDGSYDWLLPEVHSEQCRLLIRGLNNRVLADGIVFSIKRPAVDPFERLTGDPSVSANDYTFGTALFDYDNDDTPDLMLGNYRKTNSLFHNNGDGTFSTVSSTPLNIGSTYTINLAFGDYDNDGFLDIFVVNKDGRSNELFHNNGNGTYGKVSDTATYPMVNGNGQPYSCSWVDYDGDGFIDLFMPNLNKSNFLYRNNGNGSFSRITGNALSDNNRKVQGHGWCDFDNDGDMDVLLANCQGQNDDLFQNNGDGTFTRLGGALPSNDGTDTFGVAWGDYDNDGLQDAYVTANGPNILYHNESNGAFTRITEGEMVSDGGNSWGALWADFDNDGDLDLMSVNHSTVNYLYLNEGEGVFNKVSTGPSVTPNGRSFTAACDDLDNDGDLDLFVSNYAQQGFLFHNKGNGNNWLRIRPKGGADNPFSAGAVIKVTAIINGQTVVQTRQVSATMGAFVTSSPVSHFGLGDASVVEVIEVKWSSGTVRTFTNQTVNQLMVIEETDSTPKTLTVITSNGDETLTEGREFDITWSSEGAVGPVKLEYTKNGTDYIEITATTENDGDYLWTVPADSESSSCKLRISEVAGETTDESDSFFTIAPIILDTLGLTSPNGGETLQVGGSYLISWGSTGNISNVRLQYSIDNGGSWTDIIASVANGGTYNWTVPNAVSSQCLVRVSDAADDSPFDVSDSVFSIVPAPTITVTTPNGGEIFEAASSKAISWNSTGNIANVKIEYSTNNGSTWITVIDSVSNVGSYGWTVPAEDSATCLLRIGDAAGGPSDTSNNTFTIAPQRTLTLTATNGGESWEAGTEQAITWNSTGSIANVKIEYSTDSG